ncbi:MAG: DNA polymerase-1 [Verrucomicrobiales bacterium]
MSLATMATKKDFRLFLLDGMALIYRAHFALIRSPVYTSSGFNSSAIYGFANTLLDIKAKQKPTHLGLVFDTSAPTFRHVAYPEYKAQRQEMPEDLSAAIPHVKRLAEAFNIPVITMDGFEADDIIGTLAKRADDDGRFETYMVTPDKDFAQLVSETTFIYKPGRQGSDHEILSVEDILEKWEIERPEQVIDILGLWGDASDNIPGIPGIGEKTSKKLIKRFGSTEELLKNTGKLKGKQKENVINFGEQGLLSKQLATIKLDVPVEIALDELVVQDYHEDKLQAFFVEFEFNTLGQRIFGKNFKIGRGARLRAQGIDPDSLVTIESVEKRYELVDTDEKRQALLGALQKQKTFCFDTETSSLNPHTCQLLGLSFSWAQNEGYYVALPVDEAQAAEGILQMFAPVLTNPKIELVGHNLKFDISVLRARGLSVGGPFFDSMIAHALIDPDQRHGMDYLSEVYLGYTPISITSLIGEKNASDGQGSLLELSADHLEKVAQYAAEDADVTWQIAEKLRPQLKEKGQEKVFYEIECPLMPVLADMEKEGIAIDLAALAEVGDQLGKRADILRAEVFRGAGGEFNLDSPKQLGEILFEKLKLVEKPKKTKTGQYATNEQVLSTLAPQHEIVRNILDYREATKLKNTYVDNLPGDVNPNTGRIHTTFQQLMTATGRMQSSGPNLQNIPIRSEHGKEIRRAFIAGGPDRILFAADYSQIELRVMASMSGDPAMCQAFKDNTDIHSATAAAVYGVGLDGVLPEMRRTAKMVNFGIIFGITSFGLAQRLGIPKKEAETIITEYFKLYPGVKTHMDATIELAREQGYVETMTGRRRHLRDIASSNWTIRGAAERMAINTPIQGTAADMIKLAMIRVAAALKKENLRSKMLLQVHDELVFDVYRDEQILLQPLVEQCMREALELRVPVVVDTGSGANWLDAH